MGQDTRWMKRPARALGFALALAGCTQDAELVGSNCLEDDSCVEQSQPLERIDSVDILLVIDSSGSIEGESESLRAQLPRMLNAIVTGDDEETTFPPASSVHVAVATSDMGVGEVVGIDKCQGAGDNGVFLRPGEVGVTCDVSYPGYLAYEGGPATIATVETVSCLPLTGADGCGFEQPLEAGLKALWPASDDVVSFAGGPSHGEGENAGFLREDSLLVVVIVTDEDDCSAADSRVFTLPELLEPSDPLAAVPMNLRCAEGDDYLHSSARYIEHFKHLRPDNENVIFVAIAGVPPELVAEETRSDYDFGSEDEVAEYYDLVLAHPAMQETVDPASVSVAQPGAGRLLPSCTGGETAMAMPPRRLVEVAKGFGNQAVLGSICEDFGTSTGAVIRAIGERLAQAAAAADDAE